MDQFLFWHIQSIHEDGRRASIRRVQARAGDGRDTFGLEPGFQVDPGILVERISNGPRLVTVKKWRYGDNASRSTD